MRERSRQIALEAVKRIDAPVRDRARHQRRLLLLSGCASRKEQSAPLLEALEAWLREQRGRLSRSASVAEPIDYMLKRWDRFARFIDNGRICLTNNAAERALRGFALGRKSWLFAGSDRGAERAAVMGSSGFPRPEKSAVTAACQHLIDDFLKPRFLPLSGRRSSTTPSISSASGTAPSIASFNATAPVSRRISAKSSTRPSPASTGSAAIASTSSGTATPENGSACIAALASPKRLTR